MFKLFRNILIAGSHITCLTAGYACLVAAQAQPKTPPGRSATSSPETVQDYNRRLQQLDRMTGRQDANPAQWEYRIGPGDLLEISVMEAPELSRTVRVSEGGDISLPLLGAIRAGGLTTRQQESILEELLRQTYMKDPHAAVFVKEVQSHPVSVFGAVKRAGVFQTRGAKTLVEVLSMAEGLADDAGDTVLVLHDSGLEGTIPAFESSAETRHNAQAADLAPGPHLQRSVGSGTNESLQEPRTEEINLKRLLESDDPRSNVLVHGGDVVKVTRAGIVYVVGEVKRPGGFQLKTNENISVLQALALAEGLTRTSAKGHARIIRTDTAGGTRKEILVNLGKVLSGKSPDPTLEPRDILFVPNSTGRSAFYRGLESAISVGTSLAIYRR